MSQIRHCSHQLKLASPFFFQMWLSTNNPFIPPRSLYLVLLAAAKKSEQAYHEISYLPVTSRAKFDATWDPRSYHDGPKNASHVGS